MQNVGFWSETERPNDFIDVSWDRNERHAVLVYLATGKTHASYRGMASCRAGCAGSLGNKDMTDGTYVWPQGYAHYLTNHSVKPPAEFITHVLAKLAAA